MEGVKNLLVGFTKDDDRTSCAVAYGLALAQEAGAHVTIQGVSSKIVVAQPIASSVAQGLVADDNRRRLALAEAAAEAARRDAAAKGVPCVAQTVQMRLTDAAAVFGRQARLHDLTIMDRPSDLLSFPRALLEEALFASGRPAIVLPEGRTDFRLEHVMVAWDGSARAARALNEAMPFLRAAESVSLVAASEKGKDEAIPGSEIAPHLARHGIEATLVDLPVGAGGAAETLRQQAQVRRTDLIVMGAFVHSWWRQVTLGGVTEDFLENPPAPLFLSH
ncbi:universal stress protein [Enterovirga sp. DB1703]|uniref:Universal stress protein n=1 Tax=Enterovirga aerilata TaxID=2730920 RepID=A0A849I1V3_9HYPH|nr:universal stress protein [Enterovirga sp. DB1703]